MVAVAAVLATAAATGVPTLSHAATTPTVTITTPVSEGLFSANPATFSGTASSSVAITAVKWSLQNQGTST